MDELKGWIFAALITGGIFLAAAWLLSGAPR